MYLLAVTGLMYFVVLRTVGIHAGVESTKAKVAPIACPVGVKVLSVYHNSNLLVAMNDVLNIIVGENFVAHSSEITPTAERAFFGDFPTWDAGGGRQFQCRSDRPQTVYPQSSQTIRQPHA